MKKIPLKITGALALLALWTVNSQLSTARTQPVQTPDRRKPALVPPTAAIPLDQIGAVAGKQYSGDGLSVTSTSDGAILRCVFQRLNGQATQQGLWLVSTTDGSTKEPFRVMARTLGHASAELLAPSGKVQGDGQVARFIRPGVTEEYSVSIDGVSQDFVIQDRPAGQGALRMELELDGARAEPMAGGARLVLSDGGRQLVYNRLKAVDAGGKQLAANLQVVSPNRLAVLLDDAGAEYPVRIDPTFSDANWVSLGGVPGIQGQVYALAEDSAGSLYVGGSFNIAGNVLATNIAKWNGSTWSALGSGMGGANTYGPDGYGPYVSALAVSGNILYAGGDFTTAGGALQPISPNGTAALGPQSARG
jgi:hypothetical protein